MLLEKLESSLKNLKSICALGKVGENRHFKEDKVLKSYLKTNFLKLDNYGYWRSHSMTRQTLLKMYN